MYLFKVIKALILKGKYIRHSFYLTRLSDFVD